MSEYPISHCLWHIVSDTHRVQLARLWNDHITITYWVTALGSRYCRDITIILYSIGLLVSILLIYYHNTVIDLRLRATDPFSGQTKLLLSSNPVYNCFVIHIHFFKIFLFTLFSHISIRCYQYPHPSSPRIWKTHQYHVTYWTNEIRPSVNSSIAGNRSMNCWPVNRTVMQLI